MQLMMRSISTRLNSVKACLTDNDISTGPLLHLNTGTCKVLNLGKNCTTRTDHVPLDPLVRKPSQLNTLLPWALPVAIFAEYQYMKGRLELGKAGSPEPCTPAPGFLSSVKLSDKTTADQIKIQSASSDRLITKSALPTDMPQIRSSPFL